MSAWFLTVCLCSCIAGIYALGYWWHRYLTGSDESDAVKVQVFGE